MMKIVLGTLFVSQLITATAFAGPLTSGGGFAVVCRDSKDKIISAELLDLYEAKEKFKYELVESTGSLEGDYLQAVGNTYRLQGYPDMVLDIPELRKNLKTFFNRVVFLPRGTILPNLYDLGDHVKAPLGCEVEPLAIWNDEITQIKIRSEIWDELDSLSQAALVEHELAYSYNRSFLLDQTSEGARAFVGIIFSKNIKPALTDEIKALPRMASFYTLSSGVQLSTNIHFEKRNSYYKMYFSYVAGRALVTEAIAEFNFDGIVLKQKFLPERNGFFVVAEVDRVITKRTILQTAQSEKWGVEFTFIPNQPVKIGLIENGILVLESYLTTLSK